jgi:hypothetical protein
MKKIIVAALVAATAGLGPGITNAHASTRGAERALKSELNYDYGTTGRFADYRAPIDGCKRRGRGYYTCTFTLYERPPGSSIRLGVARVYQYGGSYSVSYRIR